MNKILIGSDPEIFLKNTETGKVDSVINKLGGTKEEPIDIGEGCAVQEDNILAEFNIPPVSTKKDFIKKINYAKTFIETIVSGLGLELHYSSSELVDEEVLSDDKACEFGCQPTMNVVTQTTNSVKVSNSDPDDIRRLRTSGFHIHIGYENPTPSMNERLVLAFELMVSMAMVGLDNDKYHRRKLYGCFGEYRPKSYGVECRSLGGYFLKDDDSIGLVYDNTLKAIKLAHSSIDLEDLRKMVNYCIDEVNELNIDNYKEVIKEVTEVKKLITI